MATDDVLKEVLTEDELNAYHEGTCYVTPMMSNHRACIRRLAALLAEQREEHARVAERMADAWCKSSLFEKLTDDEKRIGRKAAEAIALAIRNPEPTPPAKDSTNA